MSAVVKPTFRGDSVRDALFDELAWAGIEALQLVSLRINRHTPEGMVAATPLTQKQAVWLAERTLIPVKLCEDEKVFGLREVTLYPASYARLVDELLAVAKKYETSAEFELGGGRARGGLFRVTRIYDIPVVNFIPGFKASWPA